MTDLTGKTAFRYGRGGCLILQVQERYVHTTYDNGLVHSEDGTRWRDATVRDVTISGGQRMTEKAASLVKRLRTMAGIGWNPIGDEAADRIEQLEEIVREVMAGRYDDARLLTANLEDMDE